MQRILLLPLLIFSIAVPVALSAEPDEDTLEPPSRLIYMRAVETALWAAPAVAVSSEIRAIREAGAGEFDFVYSKSRPGSGWRLPSADPSSPVAIAAFSLQKGPVVVSIPASGKARIYGGVFDAWHETVVNVGPADQSRQYLILPPNYAITKPMDGDRIGLKSNTNTVLVNFRAVPAGFDDQAWSEAAEALKGIRIYPLSQASEPSASRFIDASAGAFDAGFKFDLTYFKAIFDLVQKDPVREQDKMAMGMLSTLGIVRGGEFKLDERFSRVMSRALADVYAFLGDRIEQGQYSGRLWDDRAWAFVGEHSLSGQYPDRLDTIERAKAYYFGLADNERLMCDTLGVNAILVTAVDKYGATLDGGKNYRLVLPANIPAASFWTATAYDVYSRALVKSPKTFVSSRDPALAADGAGAVAIALGPDASGANAIATKAGEAYYLVLRFHGPVGQSFQSWKPGDVEAK